MKIEATKGYQIVSEWLQAAGRLPFSFQKDCWQSFARGYQGMVIAPTGFGKTFSVFLAVIIDFLNHPERKKEGLQLVWITPLRSLAKDIARAMTEALEGLGMDWEVGVRNGDTDMTVRQRQTRNMPEVLLLTPESLHLLLAQKDNARFFKNLKCIAVDEWHELLGSKRGVMVELAIGHICAMVKGVKVWGITATIGNLQEAMDVLVPVAVKKKMIVAKEKKRTEIISIVPDEIEILPWAGHLGLAMAQKIVPVIYEGNSTLIFTNTRGQAELWYQTLITHFPDLIGQIAIHHSSIDFEQRIWIEEALSAGLLKAVICTSSLDLGVDFKPVDTAVQIGSPKGVARFLQRAGRSGHSPFELSKIYFVPTHSLELIEGAALKEATRTGAVESRIPMILCFDVLIQYLVTLAIGDGFDENLFEEIRNTYAFRYMEAEEWKWVLLFITQGGRALEAYHEYHKVVKVENVYRVVNRRIAMTHRMNIGVIVSEVMLKVRYMKGGYVGMIEEYFVSKLKAGDSFVLAGRILEFVMMKEMMVLVRISKKTKAITPSWLGGRLPLSSNLSHFLRKKIGEALSPGTKERELKLLAPLFARQEHTSHIPHADELLVEMIDTREGYHLFIYPFEGRLIHEVMASLIAYRISKLQPISFSIAMNDYGFELLSDQPIPVSDERLEYLFTEENLMQDVAASINATEMARRKFRDIAVVSGMVIQNYLGDKKNNKSLQASSGLIFNVLEAYDKDNLLLKQAYHEVFAEQIEEQRLKEAFRRISGSKIILKKATVFTPLSFPIKVDSLRHTLSSEDLAARVEKLKSNSKTVTRGN